MCAGESQEKVDNDISSGNPGHPDVRQWREQKMKVGSSH
jgi:hypothetical protein